MTLYKLFQEALNKEFMNRTIQHTRLESVRFKVGCIEYDDVENMVHLSSLDYENYITPPWDRSKTGAERECISITIGEPLPKIVD